MTDVKKQPTEQKPRNRIHKWIRRFFILWAIVSTLYLANTVRTRDVAPALLQNSDSVSVVDRSEWLAFLPQTASESGLVFICGSGVAAEAYAPLLRPLAEDGFPVIVVRLPWRFAPLEKHKRAALDRVRHAMASYRNVQNWLVAGHSLGGALACRLVREDPEQFRGLVLIGTTHPKAVDMSDLTLPVVKVAGTRDGVAPMKQVKANRHLLPSHTVFRWIEGANHSRFGHYGHQLFDDTATISRDEQQRITRETLRNALAHKSPENKGSD